MLNLLKQFALAQHRAGEFASEHRVELNDSSTIQLVNHLIQQVHQQGGWSENIPRSLLSFILCQTAHRYYVFSDRLLNQCQKPENAEQYDIALILPRLMQLAETLEFYQTLDVQYPIPETRLSSIQALTNQLFAMLAVNFPSQLKELEAHWSVCLPTLLPFAREASEYEPVYSSTHRQFMGAVNKTQCIFAPTGKYWGAEDWDESHSFDDNILRFSQGFFRFMAVSKKEQLKGFALRLPAHYSETLEKLSQTVAQFLSALNQQDPARSTCLTQNIETADWKYSWAGEPLFLTAFGTCYPLKHPRSPYGFDQTYFFLQPDFVLRNHPGLTDGKEQQSRDRILQNFERNDMSYDNRGKEKEVERFIRPLRATDPAVQWWKHL